MDRRRVPRGRCGAYIRAEQTALACGPRAGRRGGAQPDSARVPVGREEEDSPNRQGPSVGESGREGGEADWTGRGEWADGAPWAAGGKKRKKMREMEGWAGWTGNQESEREKLSIFFPKEKQTHSNLNLNTRIQIQTEQQTIKLCKDSMNA